jgi:hypothetical protein
MNPETLTQIQFYKNQIALYEANRQAAFHKIPYDYAIMIYNNEILELLNK